MEHEEKKAYGRILVVDDLKINLDVVKRLLQKTKLQVETVLSGQEAIDRIVEDFLKKMPDTASDRERIKYVYEYLIDTVKYDDSVPPDRDQNMDSALLGKRTVCAGYAKAARYLLDQIGIPSIYVSDEEHAWNKVVCDHKTYTMDVTWGAVESQEAGTINYDYLLVP